MVQKLSLVEWLGSHKGALYISGFGTDMGLCDWITPNMTLGESFLEIEPGVQTGLKNGLTLMLDAETFDYGLNLE